MVQAPVSCLCTDPRSAWELRGHEGEKEEAHPCLHPTSQLGLVDVCRMTEKATTVNKHKYTSLLDFCEAKQQGSVQNISLILTSVSSQS